MLSLFLFCRLVTVTDLHVRLAPLARDSHQNTLCSVLPQGMEPRLCRYENHKQRGAVWGNSSISTRAKKNQSQNRCDGEFLIYMQHGRGTPQKRSAVHRDHISIPGANGVKQQQGTIYFTDNQLWLDSCHKSCKASHAFVTEHNTLRPHPFVLHAALCCVYIKTWECSALMRMNTLRCAITQRLLLFLHRPEIPIHCPFPVPALPPCRRIMISLMKCTAARWGETFFVMLASNSHCYHIPEIV